MSVILPVRNRRELLKATLDGLEAQRYRDFEVIVADDGSSDGSDEHAAGRIVAGRAVRVIDGGGNGAVAARVAAVAVAEGDVLAFTDSDCVPSPEWLEAGMLALDWGADVVHGCTRAARPPLPLERTMTSDTEGLYPTCNILYCRSTFERAGGFDGAVGARWGFRPDRRSRGDGFGEDTLLAWRALRMGAVFEYVPEALVHHHVFPPGDWSELVSRTARVAAFPAMFKEVPELRRRALCRWRVQLGPRTRAPVYLLGASVIAGRKGTAVVALAWWIVLRHRELSRTGAPMADRLKVLPVEMAIDALSGAALLLGSARTRTLLV